MTDDPALNSAPPSSAAPVDDETPYFLVWNDPVDLRQLSVSVVVCSVVSLATFLTARELIGRVVTTDSLTGGYALLAGLVGCIAAAALCAKLYPPKRTFSDEGDSRRATAVAELKELGGTAEAFDELPDSVKAEMVELGLAPRPVAVTRKTTT